MFSTAVVWFPSWVPPAPTTTTSYVSSISACASWATVLFLNVSILVAPAWVAASFKASLIALLVKVAPDTISIPEPLASIASGIIISNAGVPT